MKNEETRTAEEQLLLLSKKSIKQLEGIQKWTMILSIGGGVMVSVVVIAVLAMIIYSPPEMENLRVSLITNVVAMSIYLLPMYFLLRFALSVKKGIKSKQEPLLSEAFSFLHIHYQILGIILLLFGGLIVLGIAVLLIALISGQLPILT